MRGKIVKRERLQHGVNVLKVP
uniref:Uncharacterized protein n=1 Tax=Anguilla anguilla TaxID=7936 RepID=A0A0E9UAR1_ANGAN